MARFISPGFEFSIKDAVCFEPVVPTVCLLCVLTRHRISMILLSVEEADQLLLIPHGNGGQQP